MARDDGKLDLLVVAAHPDDAEIALGGTILATISSGSRVGIVDLSRGELSSRGTPELRARETAAATELLGIHWRACLDLPDGSIRDDDASRKALVAVFRETRPRVVLAPWKDDLHPDHAGAGLLTYRSLYLGGVRHYRTGGSESVLQHRAAALGYYMCHTPFEPSVVVDISEHWNRKLEVIRCYSSQFHDPTQEGPPTKISHPGFMAAVEGRARDLGSRCGVEMGEAITWQDPPAVANPVDLVVGEGLTTDPSDVSETGD
ncbi:MAG: bacillithiol biosynthesis deacetylase BshB1 [Planctomycetota bacterium]|nr:bacillithiol biosynthesis deacetylase BshB1 [Planctomycetota bacterium]